MDIYLYIFILHIQYYIFVYFVQCFPKIYIKYSSTHIYHIIVLILMVIIQIVFTINTIQNTKLSLLYVEIYINFNNLPKNNKNSQIFQNNEYWLEHL